MLTESTKPRRRRTAPPSAPPTESLWPAEVDLILSALDAGARATGDRRIGTRMPYRVRGELKLFSDQPGIAPWVMYTRDVDPRGLGFVTPHRLPLGYGGTIILPGPGGKTERIHCTIYRCREVSNGWYEGALYFNGEQVMFAAE